MGERERTMNAYNLPLLDGVETFGRWDIPTLAPCDAIPEDLIGFNYVRGMADSAKPGNGAHFFLDDYQFERIWRHPERYVDMLRPFRCVLAPDFSLYTDMPMAMQLHNVYRSRLIGAYWQRHGLSVIPTLQWSTPESYAFAFDGLPIGSVVAASTLGVLGDLGAVRLWRMGMSEAIRRLRPGLVLLYGSPMTGFDWQGTAYIGYRNRNTERVKAWEAEARQAVLAGTGNRTAASTGPCSNSVTSNSWSEGTRRTPRHLSKP
ncbi:DUF4417 domain-containing protein [Bifidobacterium sp. 82T24]|uniref:DUF4417 domain-containing protein n=1 Tax=Bifidobacterium pluvialisilvae TaxID=2834436 RepID=UPI001C56CFA7|nr:DUF4417 domain-containing protein [Bifidobacterium pluvialisilvae]MBW3088814.1 DUF4417 domain-containing protein [Bifidobacterium pluvialisilvae]